MKKLSKVLLAGGLTLLILLVAAAVTGAFLVSSPNPEGLPVARFVVSEGESLNEISQDLEKRHLIRSAFALKFYSQLRGTAGKFQKGVYEVPAGSNLFAVHDQLISGRQELVTLPEGLTSRQIAQILAERQIVPEQDFLKAVKKNDKLAQKYGLPVTNLEGFLFPDTYQFSPTNNPDEIIEPMVANFVTKLTGLKLPVPALTYKDFYNKLIVASIVEKEYRVPEEAGLMASVFFNRYQHKIALASCATVVYTITEIEGRPKPQRIYLKDTQIKSPYNTYIHRELPPGPISNPGLTALQAALAPPETDFLYFVLKDPKAGRHTFSTNYRDHNTARDEYLSQFVTK